MREADPPHQDPRARALEILRLYGADATSFQLLAPGYGFFFAHGGFVAYADTGSAWVAGGGPVASPERRAALAQAFVAEAEHRGRRASFFAVDDAFCKAARLPHVRVGEQPCWEPARWESTLAENASLRYQVRRALAKRVAIRRVPATEMADPDSATRRAVDDLARAWLGDQPLAPMGFLVELAPYDFPSERIHLVAEQAGRIVGFLAAAPVYARRGWLVENLVRAQHAPNGTAELLVDRMMRLAAEAESALVTLGLAPLGGPVPRRLRAARVLSTPLYDFRGLHAFKAKLRPHGWESIHVAAAPGRSPWIALRDGLTAFARGSLVRFGLSTLARGPLAVLWALTALLIVWTPLLALRQATRFFPSPHVQHAWIAFDVLLAIALWALCRRHRSWLALGVAAAVTLDAVATTAEALAFNVRHIRSALDACFVVLACVAPALSAVALWGFVRRRRAVLQP